MSTLSVGDLQGLAVNSNVVTVPTGHTLNVTDAAGLQIGGSAITQGKILQVVSTTKSDSFTTTSATFVDVTGMSVTITPTAATSTIYVLATLTAANASGHSALINLLRDSTNISQSTGGASVNMTKYAKNPSAENTNFPTILFQDSPATTSATTYKIQIATSTAGNTVAVNRRADNNTYGSTSSITVMEVSA